MKATKLIGFILIILGLLIGLLSYTNLLVGPEAAGYLILWIAIPIIILGVLLLLSLTGALIFLAGLLIFFIFLLGAAKQSSLALLTTGFWIVYLLMVIGILWSVIESIIKLTKKEKVKKRR